MKKTMLMLIILIIAALALGACANDQPTEVMESEVSTPEETATEEVKEPVGAESYPAPESEGEAAVPQNESAAAAYPVTEDEISFLTRTWVLTSYAEDTIAGAVPDKTLTLNSDRTYEIILDDDTNSGTWEIFLGVQPALILDPGTDSMMNLQVVDLTEDMLQLQYSVDGVQINEQYQPVE
jgi:hypothetical protein